MAHQNVALCNAALAYGVPCVHTYMADGCITLCGRSLELTPQDGVCYIVDEDTWLDNRGRNDLIRADYYGRGHGFELYELRYWKDGTRVYPRTGVVYG